MNDLKTKQMDSSLDPDSCQGDRRKGWVFSPLLDAIAFTGPILLSFALYFMVTGNIPTEEVLNAEGAQSFPHWLLFILIVLFDVPHAHATVFRTYLDKSEFQKRKRFYQLLPIFVYFALLLALAVSETALVRIIAYAAIFHSIRQHYGWVSYSRRSAKETNTWGKVFDAVLVYSLTIIPLIFMHLNSFNTHRSSFWYVENDLLQFEAHPVFEGWLLSLYWFVITSYLLHLAYSGMKSRSLNFGKIHILATTGAVWYLSLIHYQSFLLFFCLHVISHAVPYFLLVFKYSKKTHLPQTPVGRLFVGWGVCVLVALLFTVSYFDSWLRELVYWQTDSSFFIQFDFEDSAFLMGLGYALVPLVALVPMMHYIVDGVIWKTSNDSSLGKKV